MTNSPALLSGALSQLQKYFDENQLQAASLQELERYLSALVGNLLQTDLNRLLHILYRIDVAEEKVKTAFSIGTEKEIAAAVARLIIRRVLQKVQTRLTYSQ